MIYKNNLLLAVMCSLCFMSTGCMSEEAKNIQKQIDTLPESYSEDIDDTINAIRNSVDQLTEEDRNDLSVSTLEKLENERIDRLAEKIQKSIDALPDEYSKDIDEKLSEINIAYEQESDEVKNKVKPERLQKLLIQQIQTLMDALPGTYKKEYEDRIDTALIAYESASSEIKEKVDSSRLNNLIEQKEMAVITPEIEDKIIDVLNSTPVHSLFGASIGHIITVVFWDYDITIEWISPNLYSVEISGRYRPNTNVTQMAYTGSITYQVDISDGTCKISQDPDNISASFYSFAVNGW